MKRGANKKGLSPVIATVLLVMIAIVIALIILLWAKDVFKEKTLKFGSNIENSCGDIIFQAEAVSDDQTINIVNEGTIPIYGIKLNQKGLGFSSERALFSNTIGTGETVNIEATVLATDLQLSQNDEFTVYPILIGEAGETKKTYVCEAQGLDIIVI
jgi:flagellin-like protein